MFPPNIKADRQGKQSKQLEDICCALDFGKDHGQIISLLGNLISLPTEIRHVNQLILSKAVCFLFLKNNLLKLNSHNLKLTILI